METFFTEAAEQLGTLKTTDGARYDTLLTRVNTESLFMKYMQIEFYSDYYTKTELTAMIDEFEKNANFAGLKYLNSKKTSTVSSVINSWRTKL